MVKIILPHNSKRKEYVLYLYKNRNNFHIMNNRDINNLVKLINTGKLDKDDYPTFQEEKKEKGGILKGFCFRYDNNCKNLF